ncbi:MAG: NAD(+)/NADH kinase [Candidatus Yanofskybacteria bacterium]|nr:NAD(+)/NADH kinase [Candidatus Yanofskybacteria bacterium]
MGRQQIKTVGFFFRPENRRAVLWHKKISGLLKKHYRSVKINERATQALIVLGGDGTILEAARKYQKKRPLILGLNLGNVGFLASAREPAKFMASVKKFIAGDYKIIDRMMLKATVMRNKKAVFRTESMNDVVVQNPFGMVSLRVDIEDHPVQNIRGTGVLVATATGSTAYNLSAHGPIVMPDIKGFILTEILDHNIPTPSIVVKYNRKIFIKVADFRERGLFSIGENGQKVDVVMISDGEKIFPLKRNDVIRIEYSPHMIRFAELEPHYFFKSLQEKFGF